MFKLQGAASTEHIGVLEGQEVGWFSHLCWHHDSSFQQLP